MEKNQTATAEVNETTKKTSSSISKEGVLIKHTQSSKGKRHTTLKKLFEDLLMDTYSAEKQLVEALPKMAAAAFTEDLEDVFSSHLEETKRHVDRLEKVFTRLSIGKKNVTCEAMEGLIAEVKKVISDYDESPVRDSALIISAQKVEHYEIAAYGSLCELADVLGYMNVQDILDRTLEEEEAADDFLTDIAKDVNDNAFEMDDNPDED